MGLLGKLFGIENKGKIGITVAKPSYIAGELVTGTIYVSVTEPIQCDAVILKATGKEKVSWTETKTETDGEGQTRTTEEHHDKDKEFFKQKIVISQIPQTFAPGNYMYAFEYPLPPDLPGVFHLKSYSDGSVRDLKATIRYKFKATLDIGGALAKDLKATCDLVVHERLAEDVRPSEDAVQQRVRWLCCLDKGECQLAVAMDKNVYLPGETAQIQCRVTNASEVDVRAMNCRLYQDLAIRVPGHGHRFTRALCRATFPGVPAHGALEQPQPLPLVPNTGAAEHINPSTTGTLISCAYRVDVECDIPWCPDVHLRMPVRIVAPMIPNVSWVPTSTEGFAEPLLR